MITEDELRDRLARAASKSDVTFSAHEVRARAAATGHRAPRAGRWLFAGIAASVAAIAAFAVPSVVGRSGQIDAVASESTTTAPITTAPITAAPITTSDASVPDTPTSSTPAEPTSEVQMPPTICGNELPARFTLVSAGTEPATSSRVDSGRLIVEFTDSAGTGVSVSWPPAPRALYGDAPDYRIFPNTADSMIGPDGRTTAQRLTFLDTRQNEFDVDQGDAIGPVLDIEEFGGPSPLDDLPAECGRVEVAPLGMEASDATEIGRYAIDLFWLGQEDASFAARDARGSHLVDLSPRVTSSEMVDVLPRSEPVQCDDESVPSESAPVVEPQVFPTSAEALDTFLDTNPAATTFIPTGWHEMVSDGAVGYGIPFDDVPGGPTSQTKMITVVYVEQTSDGWVVTDWISSGC